MAGSSRNGGEAEQAPTDSIDRVVAGWSELRPELEVSPIEVVARLQRLRGYVDHELEATFAEFQLTGPSFSVLATVTRLGGRTAQRALMDELRLTSGTVSVRIDRLVEDGLVVREPDPSDTRGAVVRLTEEGRRRFEACVVAHLAHEERLLAALSEDERELLASLLRRLLISFEGTRSLHGRLPYLGLTLAPAHVAIEMRRSVGLPERTGLLVRAIAGDGPAASSELEVGDVLVSAGGRELRSIASLYAALGAATQSGCLRVRVVRGTEEIGVELELGSSPRRPAAERGDGARRRREVAHEL